MSNNELSAARFFDEMVERYDQAIYRCVPRYDEMQSQMLDYVLLSNPTKVLELGCGSGNLTAKLLDRYQDAHVSVVDASGEMIRICRERFPETTRMEFCEKSFQQLTFDEDSFDLVVSSISIHHLNDAEKLELFSKVRNWLTSGGVFTFCDQFAGETPGLYSRHMEHWKQASFELGATQQEWDDWMSHQEAHDYHSSLPTHLNLMQQAGFQSVDCTRRYFLWTTMIGFAQQG